MDEATTRSESGQACDASTYAPPTVEVISLDCEITSYAPDEDDTPLF
jgi:hypothetical protein